MENTGAYRHELKYPVNYFEYAAIRARLQPVMKGDLHTGADGKYKIRSIYFDNFDDKALREKINGVQKREKFRIRWYNDDLSYIVLEKKMKLNSLCMKYSQQITESECQSLLAGKYGWMLSHPSGLVNELRCKMTIQQLRPRVMVSYTREPYVYAPGNVRVTFDYDIRTSLFTKNWLAEDVNDINAGDSSGEIIMEVKYDEFLPDVIAELLQTEGIRQEAFSKYGACRRFG